MRILALLVLTLLPAFVAASEPTFETSEVFPPGVNGIAHYRIPGIVVTPKGTVLAYCEARKNNSSDWGEIEVHLRSSTDGRKQGCNRNITPITVSGWKGIREKQKVASARKRSITPSLSSTIRLEPSSSCTASITLAALRCAARTMASSGASLWRSLLHLSPSARGMTGKSSP